MIALDNSEASILGTLVLKNQTYRERANVHHFDFRKSNYLQPLGSHLAGTCCSPSGQVSASGCKWLLGQVAATSCN